MPSLSLQPPPAQQRPGSRTGQQLRAQGQGWTHGGGGGGEGRTSWEGKHIPEGGAGLGRASWVLTLAESVSGPSGHTAHSLGQDGSFLGCAMGYVWGRGQSHLVTQEPRPQAELAGVGLVPTPPRTPSSAGPGRGPPHGWRVAWQTHGQSRAKACCFSPSLQAGPVPSACQESPGNTE